jgi:subtilase family serine protease
MPDLAVTGAVLLGGSTLTSNAPNPTVSVTWAITNQGPGAATGTWFDEVWFSTNGLLDAQSVVVSVAGHSQGLVAGASDPVTNQVALPMAGSGNFWLFVQADSLNQQAESDEANNVSPALAGTFTLQPPDLVPEALEVAEGTTIMSNAPNPVVTVSWAVTNQGTGPARSSPSWFDVIWLSTNGVFDSQSISVGAYHYPQILAAGASYLQTNRVTLPLAGSGNFWLFVQANNNNFVFESNYANNVSAPLAGTFTLQPPDLVPVSLSLIGGVAVTATVPSPTVSLTWTVTNQGTGPATGTWLDQVWLSTNGVLDAQSVIIGDFPRSQGLAAGGAYQLTNQMILPMTASGNFWLFVQADTLNNIFESNKANNVSAPLAGTFLLGTRLGIALNNGVVQLFWPASALGFHVQKGSSLPVNQWTNLADVPVVVGQQYQVNDGAPNGQQFYRLAR